MKAISDCLHPNFMSVSEGLKWLMKISVIIPVFNQAKYVEAATKSALNQNEVDEVILIEDGSNDNSLTVCQDLVLKQNKVKLLFHSNNENKGAGASRNLGIINAANPYISFLDADDYYTKNCFSKAAELFKHNKNIDGVYGATGIHYENEQCKNEWIEKRGFEKTTLSKNLPPEQLFEALLFNTHGTFTTDAIVVKKNVFTKTGLFDENLRLHQDTAMWLKMAATCNLIAGQIEKPVATRRVHFNNRITKLNPKDFSTRDLLYQTLLEWAREANISKKKAKLIEYKIWKDRLFAYNTYSLNKQMIKNEGNNYNIVNKLRYFSDKFFHQPSLLFSKYFLYFCYETLNEKLIRTSRNV
jgi:glycosyltransferase involved in cell wall biosynthesis